MGWGLRSQQPEGWGLRAGRVGARPPSRAPRPAESSTTQSLAAGWRRGTGRRGRGSPGAAWKGPLRPSPRPLFLWPLAGASTGKAEGRGQEEQRAQGSGVRAEPCPSCRSAVPRRALTTRHGGSGGRGSPVGGGCCCHRKLEAATRSGEQEAPTAKDDRVQAGADSPFLPPPTRAHLQCPSAWPASSPHPHPSKEGVGNPRRGKGCGRASPGMSLRPGHLSHTWGHTQGPPDGSSGRGEFGGSTSSLMAT